MILQQSLQLPPGEARKTPTGLLPGVWIWSVYSQEKGFYFNGYAVQTPEGLLIVDPPEANEAIFETIDALGKPTLVVITNRDHERCAEAFHQRYQIPVTAPALDAPLLERSPEQTYQAGDLLAGVLQVLHLPEQKSPGESALYHVQNHWLLLGDALIGHPAGSLSMLLPEKYTDAAAARQGLQRLLHVSPLSAILTGDGEPILATPFDRLQETLIG